MYYLGLSEEGVLYYLTTDARLVADINEAARFPDRIAADMRALKVNQQRKRERKPRLWVIKK